MEWWYIPAALASGVLGGIIGAEIYLRIKGK